MPAIWSISPLARTAPSRCRARAYSPSLFSIALIRSKSLPKTMDPSDLPFRLWSMGPPENQTTRHREGLWKYRFERQ